MNISLAKKEYGSAYGVALLLFAAPYLPFPLTFLAVIFSAIYFLCQKKYRDALFSKKSSYILAAFLAYTIIIAVVNKNLMGIAASVTFILILLSAGCLSGVFTEPLFEKCLNLAALCAGGVSVLAIIEYVICKYALNQHSHRAALWFFNCNYLASLLVFSIIICAYKVLTKQESNKAIYYICAALSAAGIYCTASMFSWVGLFIGLATFLLCDRKHQMLSVLLLGAATMCVVIYCLPEIVPRMDLANITTDNRINIWTTSIEAIKQSPIFGRGFFTYYTVYEGLGGYPTTHAHNIVIDSILSVGIIGTVIVTVYLALFYKRVSICKNSQSKSFISSLILAFTAATLAHSMTDMTFLWVQTGLLFALVLSGIGIEEKILKLS